MMPMTQEEKQVCTPKRHWRWIFELAGIGFTAAAILFFLFAPDSVRLPVGAALFIFVAWLVCTD